jgi:hypothetical protein
VTSGLANVFGAMSQIVLVTPSQLSPMKVAIDGTQIIVPGCVLVKGFGPWAIISFLFLLLLLLDESFTF